VYRALLERLDYSRNFTLAELEYTLEGDGKLEEFESAFAEIVGLPWRERRYTSLAKRQAIEALNTLYGSASGLPGWAAELDPPDIDADWFAARALELMQRRGGGAQRLVFVVDEAGPPVHGRSRRPLLEGDGDDWPERSIVTDTQRLVQPRKWRMSSVMRGSWRLIDGHELYDLSSDPGQREDIAAQHPERAAQLRADYEAWWELVSEQFDREIPMALGGPAAQQTLLTGQDWRNGDCDCIVSQGHVRQGHDAEGHFEVDILQGGRYEFELRRWPPETQHAIDAGIEGHDVAWERE